MVSPGPVQFMAKGHDVAFLVLSSALVFIASIWFSVPQSVECFLACAFSQAGRRAQVGCRADGCTEDEGNKVQCCSSHQRIQQQAMWHPHVSCCAPSAACINASIFSRRGICRRLDFLLGLVTRGCRLEGRRYQAGSVQGASLMASEVLGLGLLAASLACRGHTGKQPLVSKMMCFRLQVQRHSHAGPGSQPAPRGYHCGEGKHSHPSCHEPCVACTVYQACAIAVCRFTSSQLVVRCQSFRVFLRLFLAGHDPQPRVCEPGYNHRGRPSHHA